MNPNCAKAVILDMDGVITRTARTHARSWKKMFDEYLELQARKSDRDYEPFDIERDYLEYIDGKPRYDGVRSFLASRGIEIATGDEQDPPDRETICGLGNRKNNLFQEELEQGGVEAFEDTVEQIQRWKRQGLPLAVISSSRNCESVMKAVKLLDLFDVKVDGCDLGPLGLKGKPAPDIFLHAAKQLGVAPADAMVIEDAQSGVQAGRRGEFGVVVGVARNQPADELRKAGADIVVRNLRELSAARFCPPGHNCLERPSSACEYADWIAGCLAEKQLALFLDYDGTLTPIVRRPEDATLTSEMRSLLEQLSKLCTLAIVSGRDRRDAENMVGIENLIYAGSHGFDVRGPGGLDMQQVGAVHALPQLDDAERTLQAQLDGIEGVRVERKKFAIAIHFREVDSEADVQRVEELIDDALAKHPGLRKRGGKKIFELQPDVPWNKGEAITWLMNALKLDLESSIVIYIGDDVTDEDAFRVLRQRGTGIGIRVADVDADVDADTDALFFLRDCGEAQDFLQSLLTLLTRNQKSDS